MQSGHGEMPGIARMHRGNRIACYPPGVEFGGDKPLRAFTAIREIADNTLRQDTGSPDFMPLKRKARYRQTGEVPVGPLVHDLTSILIKKSYGHAFRSGLIRIPEEDCRRPEAAFDALP